jgi:hypothetical protein
LTGAELKLIRQALCANVGRSLSSADMAKMVGLAPNGGADTWRKWEEDGASGPVATLMSILAYACLEHPVPDGLLEIGALMLTPGALDGDEMLVSDFPAQIAESVFREMMLAEIRRRLAP